MQPRGKGREKKGEGSKKDVAHPSRWGHSEIGKGGEDGRAGKGERWDDHQSPKAAETLRRLFDASKEGWCQELAI